MSMEKRGVVEGEGAQGPQGVQGQSYASGAQGPQGAQGSVKAAEACEKETCCGSSCGSDTISKMADVAAGIKDK